MAGNEVQRAREKGKEMGIDLNPNADGYYFENPGKDKPSGGSLDKGTTEPDWLQVERHQEEKARKEKEQSAAMEKALSADRSPPSLDKNKTPIGDKVPPYNMEGGKVTEPSPPPPVPKDTGTKDTGTKDTGTPVTSNVYDGPGSDDYDRYADPKNRASVNDIKKQAEGLLKAKEEEAKTQSPEDRAREDANKKKVADWLRRAGLGLSSAFGLYGNGLVQAAQRGNGVYDVTKLPEHAREMKEAEGKADWSNHLQTRGLYEKDGKLIRKDTGMPLSDAEAKAERDIFKDARTQTAQTQTVETPAAQEAAKIEATADARLKAAGITPENNKDYALYKQIAAGLGNASTPAEMEQAKQKFDWNATLQKYLQSNNQAFTAEQNELARSLTERMQQAGFDQAVKMADLGNKSQAEQLRYLEDIIGLSPAEAKRMVTTTDGQVALNNGISVAKAAASVVGTVVGVATGNPAAAVAGAAAGGAPVSAPLQVPAGKQEGGEVEGNPEHKDVPDTVPTVLAKGEVVIPNKAASELSPEILAEIKEKVSPKTKTGRALYKVLKDFYAKEGRS